MSVTVGSSPAWAASGRPWPSTRNSIVTFLPAITVGTGSVSSTTAHPPATANGTEPRPSIMTNIREKTRRFMGVHPCRDTISHRHSAGYHRYNRETRPVPLSGTLVGHQRLNDRDRRGPVQHRLQPERRLPVRPHQHVA